MILPHCCIATAILNMSTSVQLHTRPDLWPDSATKKSARQPPKPFALWFRWGEAAVWIGLTALFSLQELPELDCLQSWQWMTIKSSVFFSSVFQHSTVLNVFPVLSTSRRVHCHLDRFLLGTLLWCSSRRCCLHYAPQEAQPAAGM